MSFGIKDAIDIIVVATLMFYIYRLMKESGTINIFFGILAFFVAWVVMSEILDMRLIGTIMDMFMNIGLIIIVIIFQDQIKRFLVELGSHKRWSFINRVFRQNRQTLYTVMANLPKKTQQRRGRRSRRGASGGAQ